MKNAVLWALAVIGLLSVLNIEPVLNARRYTAGTLITIACPEIKTGCASPALFWLATQIVP